MHQRRLRAALSSTVVLCPAALAGAASAATVVTAPCVATVLGHVDRTVPIKGAGFTPGGFVTIGYTSATDPPVAATAVQADPAGRFVTTALPATFTSFNTQRQTFGLLAVDQTNRAITAASTFQQVRLGFTADPEPKRPTSKITYTARGFPVGKAVYAHFRFGGKTRRSVKVGTTSAPCGIVSRRMRALPTKMRFGTWKVYVDQSPTYSPSTKPQVMDSFVIYRRFR